MSVKEAFQKTEARIGTLGAVGWYQTPKLGGDYRGGTIGASPAYSFTAHAAEVSCDTETGFVKLRLERGILRWVHRAEGFAAGLAEYAGDEAFAVEIHQV